jgi:hypothetical protein
MLAYGRVMRGWPDKRSVNAHALNRVPPSPATDHRLELSVSFPDGHYLPQWTPDLCSSDEGLLPQSGLDLADMR